MDMDVPSLSGSFLNEEASVSMESPPIEEEEDEDLYYIPPRRPSLDLGPSPMETGALLYVERPKSPAESYLSMRSEGTGSSVNLAEEDRSCTKIHLERTDSFSTCYSVDSDDCEIRTKVKSKDVLDEDNSLPELKENLNDIVPPHLTIPFVFRAICRVLQELRPIGLETFRGHLWHRYPQSFSTSLQSMDIVDIVDRMLECYSLRVCLQITKTVLQQLEQKRLVDFLEDLEMENEVYYELRERLKKIYGVTECSGGEERALDEVYTNIHIVSSGNNCPNVEHEVMSIKKPLENKKNKDVCIKDIITAEFIERGVEQVVLLRGIAGSGKSVVVRKFIQEWSNQTPNHINLMFALPIKELKQKFGDSTISFLDILHHFYPETKRLKPEKYNTTKCKILYIFDGLEEITEDIDLPNTPFVFDITKPAQLHVIIASILRGQFLRCGFFLFTSRPQPNFHIPHDTKHYVFEVLGFKDEVKEEYFQKRFRDQSQADRVIAYVKSSRTLQIMCFLPLFCSLLSDLCQSIFNKQGPEAELPKGITHIYTRLFIALLDTYHKERKATVNKLEFIMALGKRAFTMLEKGEYSVCINYPGDVVPVDEREAATYSGFSTLFMVRPMPFVDEKMFSFIHPTVQEYAAALYVFLTFLNEDKNLFEAPKVKRTWKLSLNKKSSMDLYKNALERSLLCEDGKLDIFMRFLFGMSSSSNIELIQRFFNPTVKWTSVTEEARALIKKKMSENQYPARSRNLQLCLEELSLPKSEARKRSFKR